MPSTLKGQCTLLYHCFALGLLILFAIDRVMEYEEQRELEHNTKVIHTNVDKMWMT